MTHHYAEQNVVMWRGSAHLVGLMDLLRLRYAGWVTPSHDDADLHLGVLHAVAEYATPLEAARALDAEASRRRVERDRSRGPLTPRQQETIQRMEPAMWTRKERVKTARARDAAVAERRRRAA